jgi:hypothetical protein
MAATAAPRFQAGFAFAISPAKPQSRSKRKDQEEEYYQLILAPFTKPPKISFGSVKINELVQRSVCITNPQVFPLEVVISNQELNINNVKVSIASMQDVNLCIKWQPEKPDSYKYSILVECSGINGASKFLIHAFGICVKPPEVKKPIRKPLVTLQPLKREKTSASSLQAIKNEPAVPPSVKPAATKPATASLTVTKKVFDQTILVKQEKQVASNAATAVAKSNKENSSSQASSLARNAMYNTARLYADDHNDDDDNYLACEKTPRPESFFQAPALSMTDASLTPKLSDFMTPTPGLTSDFSMIDSTFQQTTVFQTTTTFVDSGASMMIDQAEDFLKTPNLNAITFKRKVRFLNFINFWL